MKIRIAGDIDPQLHGEYELAFPPYKTNEWRAVKQKTGLLPMDFQDHTERQDPDVYASLLFITLTRAGHDPKFVWGQIDNVDLFDSDLFSEVEEPAAQGDDSPPAETPSDDDGKETETDAERESSGQSSTAPLALLESHPSLTGSPRSATGAA